MPLLFRRFSIILSIVIALASATNAQAIWQPFSDKEAGFTISFPGSPTYEQVPIPQSEGMEEKYKFQYGGNFLSISFAPLLKLPRNPVELSQVFAEVTREQAKTGTLIHMEKRPDGSRQYYNIINESSGTLHMLTRVYIYRGRHYQLVYGTFASKGIDERVADQFFSSFRFIDVLSKRSESAQSSVTEGTNLRNIRRSKWYVLQSPENDFVARFPGKPTYSLEPQTNIGINVHKFHFFFGENLFILTHWEVQEGKIQPDQFLRRIVEVHALSEKVKRQVLRQVKLANGGYQVDSQGDFNGIYLYSRVRFYIRGTRLYTLTTLTDTPMGPNNGDADRFFASFRLL